MGRDKALLPWPPEIGQTGNWSNTFLGAAIEMLRPHTDMVIVVAGGNHEAISPVVYSAGAFLTLNEHWEQGQFSSLRTGLQEVLNRGRDAAIVALVDRPPVLPETIEALRASYIASPDRYWAIVPEFEGKHGHPMAIGREMIEAFVRASAASNAREVEHANAEHIFYLPVKDARICMNIDTPEDYSRLSEAKAGTTH